MSSRIGMLPRLLLLLLLAICDFTTFPSLHMEVAAASQMMETATNRTATHTASPTCVPLQGIESNATGSLDPDYFLDLDVLQVSLKYEVYEVSNPVLRKFAECTAGLETPISMRNLLGGSQQLLPILR